MTGAALNRGSERARLEIVRAAVRLMAAASAIALLSAASASAGPVAPSGAEQGKPGKFTVLSDTMEVSKDDGTAVFKGDVAASEDFLVCSDELAISYEKQGGIGKVTASGGVRLYHGAITGRSDSAVYLRRERKMLLIGRAEVVKCSDKLAGDRITVDLDTDRAVVEGGKPDSRVKAVITPDKPCNETAPEGNRLEKPTGERARCQWPR